MIDHILESQQIKKYIKWSIDKYSTTQKLEKQIQGIIFSELMNQSKILPLLEAKEFNNCDILIDGTIVELKYQFEFDLQEIIEYYKSNKYAKLARSIEVDIKKSHIFLMFILERLPSYSSDSFIFSDGCIAFLKNNFDLAMIANEYSKIITHLYPCKVVNFIENFICHEDQWSLHVLQVQDAQ